MIDLLGFWFAVSLTLFFLLVPFSPIIQALVEHFVSEVLGSTWKGVNAVESYYNCGPNEGLMIMGKRYLSDVAIMWSIVIGVLGWGIMIVNLGVKSEQGTPVSLVSAVAEFADTFTPLTSYLFVFFVAYYGGIYLVRKYITLKEKLTTLNKKLKEKEDDV